MRSFLIVIAAGFMVSALPAAAQSARTNAAPSAPDNAASERSQGNGSAGAGAAAERRICVNMELSGSHMVRRVCRTQAEWDARGGLDTDR
jgi:hypothetical protein